MDASTANTIKRFAPLAAAAALLIALLAVLMVLSPSTKSKQTAKESVFTEDFIESLRLQKNAYQKRTQIAPPKPEDQRTAANRPAFLENLKAAGSELKAAKDLIARYKDSQNTTIKKVAASVLSLYDKQIRINGRAQKVYGQLYDPATMNSLSSYDQGKLISEARKIPSEQTAGEEGLVGISILVTHTLYSDATDKEGKMSFLAVTSGQRERLIKKIDQYFPAASSIKTVKNPDTMDTCAAGIRAVLTGKYKSINER